MIRDIGALGSTEFDILVVGAGIHGVCVARDAALRGFRVALIDRGDFGAGTSHNSLKLLHGGFRYLQHADLRRIRDSVRERRYWLWAAPHLTRPLKCVMPLYGHGLRGPAALAAANLIYGAVAADRNDGLEGAQRVPGGGVVSAATCRDLIPGIETDGLTGGAFWYDGQMLDADRILLECVMDTETHGGIVANYVEATGFLRTGERIEGVTARDKLDGSDLEIKARITMNTCGPWVDTLLRSGSNLHREGMTGLSKCMNLVVRRSPPEHAFGVQSRRSSDALLGRDRRMFFFTPWQDRTVIGTSHLPYSGDPDDYHVNDADVAEFMQEINAAYPGAALTFDDIDYVYGGLTPAEDSGLQKGEVARVRRSAVVDHLAQNGADGLLSVVGVKWTTAELVAEKATDVAVARLGRSEKSVTQTAALPGREESAMPGAMLGERCLAAIRHGMARRLGDVVFRRLAESHCGTLDARRLQEIADIMARELRWSPERHRDEIEAVKKDRWWRFGAAQSKALNGSPSYASQNL